MSEKIRIILAEDQELFRKSLVALLNSTPEFNVVSQAANGRELLEELKRTEADVVLMDVEMPVMDGKTAMEIIAKRFPETRIIILSIHCEPSRVSDFMAHGASSFLSKNCNVETLFNAIKIVKNEGFYFDKSTSKAMLETIVKDKTSEADLQGIVFNDRETEVLKRICDGKTNKEIANSMHLSTSTIDFYRTKIYNKTKCNNVTSLLKFALRNGIVALS